ncbi:unnamed protein product [Closterium sp. Yama58-4]|nr:unnamed protein product [Closterium sp. Yama58-4]
MASQRHNPDEEMMLADVELQLDLPNAHALSAAPPATTVASPPSAAPPISPAFAAPSAAPVISPSAADPPRQRASAAASGVPEDQADQADTLAISRNLRRQRAAILIPVMPPRRLAVVEILFPEAGAEAIRADLITRISRHLQPFHFRNNVVPEFQPSVGEVLRIPRRAYARLCFSWPSQDDADDFKSLFPLTFHLPNSRSVVLKVHVDRYPRFTSAKAGGAATLTLRNVPPGYAPEDLRTFLMHQDVAGEPSWLADLQFFHQIKDPYEDMYLPIFTGIPLPPQDDPDFLRIPAVLNFEFDSPPALLNISSHVCTFCGNNHRDADHEIFPTKRRQRLTNRQQLSVAQLQQANNAPHVLPTLYLASVPAQADLLLASGMRLRPSPFPQPAAPISLSLTPSYALPHPQALPHEPALHLQFSPAPHLGPSLTAPPPPLSAGIPSMGRFSAPTSRQALGSRAAPAAFRNDPGMLYIGLDADVEPWTCALCNLTCGAALDSAMAHIASEPYVAKKLSAAHLPAAKEKYTGWKAMTFVALPQIADFLAQL